VITHTDLLQPKGELEYELFPHLGTPGGELDRAAIEARLDEYCDEAYARAASLSLESGDYDGYAVHWAYFRAYFAVYQRLIATASEARIDGQGSRKYDPKQATAFLALAEQHKAEAEALVPETTDTAAPDVPPSSSFRHRVEW